MNIKDPSLTGQGMVSVFRINIMANYMYHLGLLSLLLCAIGFMTLYFFLVIIVINFFSLWRAFDQIGFHIKKSKFYSFKLWIINAFLLYWCQDTDVDSYIQVPDLK